MENNKETKFVKVEIPKRYVDVESKDSLLIEVVGTRFGVPKKCCFNNEFKMTFVLSVSDTFEFRDQHDNLLSIYDIKDLIVKAY